MAVSWEGLQFNQICEVQDLALSAGYDPRSKNPFQRGIHYWPRASNFDAEAIILFSSPNGPYEDRIGGPRLDYPGEISKQYASRDANPRNLVTMTRGEGFPFLHFIRVGRGKLRFKGVYSIVARTPVMGPNKDGFMCENYIFHLERADMRFGVPQYDSLVLQEAAGKREYRRVSQLARNPNFRPAVLNRYGRACALCEWDVEFEESLGLDAAHIVPASVQGPDVSANGVPLCKNHHWLYDKDGWAFDEGLNVTFSSKVDLASSVLRGIRRKLEFSIRGAEAPDATFVGRRLAMFWKAEEMRLGGEL